MQRKHRKPERAFLPKMKASDDLAEVLAEEFVEAATSGEDRAEARRDEVFAEEVGGPFLEEKVDE